MEITHETRARIFGLYLGCEVQYGYEGRTRTGKLEGLNEKGEAIIFDPGIKVFSHYRYVRFELAQLLLSPLEAITDAEFVEVFGMKSRFLANSVQWMAANNMLSYQQADRLRELHYALPYGEVRDLFECGIAIDKTKKPTV